MRRAHGRFGVARAVVALRPHLKATSTGGQRVVTIATTTAAGLGIGLAATAPTVTGLALGVGIAVTGAVFGLRAAWSRLRARAPPVEWSTTAVAVSGAVLAFAALLTHGAIVTAPWAAVVHDFATHSTALVTIKLLAVAAVIRMPVVWRSVHNRQWGNAALRGRATRPRRDAWISALSYGLVWNNYNLVRYIAHLRFAGPVLFAIGIAASAVVRKSSGFPRLLGALLGGVVFWKVSPSVVTLATSSPAHTLGQYLAPLPLWIALLTVGSPLTGLITSGAGKAASRPARQRRSHHRRLADYSPPPGGEVPERSSLPQRLRRFMARWGPSDTNVHGPSAPADIRSARAAGRAESNFLGLGRADWRILALSGPVESVFYALLSWWVMQPLPGVPETPTAVALRIAGAGLATAIFLWRLNRFERLRKLFGHISQRLRDPPGRMPHVTLRPFRVQLTDEAKIGRRIEPYPEHLRELLERAGYRGARDAQLLSDDALATTVAQWMTRTLMTPVREWANLREIPGEPAALAAARAELRVMWHDRHKQHRRALALAVAVIASEPEPLQRTAQRRRKVGKYGDAEIVEFQVDVLRQLEPAVLAAMDMSEDAGLARDELEPKLADELRERHERRLVFLAQLVAFKRMWRDEHASSFFDRVRAWVGVKMAESDLARERAQKVDPEAKVAAIWLLRTRRHSMQRLIHNERNALEVALKYGLDPEDPYV
ncbi:MAG: hypothetical protein ACRDRL_20985, partial [Sciscionella sp.]